MTLLLFSIVYFSIIIIDFLTTRFLKNVSIDLDDGNKKLPYLQFNPDGTRKAVELKIMNLRPNQSKRLAWEQVGLPQRLTFVAFQLFHVQRLNFSMCIVCNDLKPTWNKCRSTCINFLNLTKIAPRKI